MQLCGLQPCLVDLVDHPARMFVAKDTDGENFGGQTATDVVRTLHGDLPRRRRKDEADGIGSHCDGEKRVVLCRDSADLDEHQVRQY
jgi:hypothetical protein